MNTSGRISRRLNRSPERTGLRTRTNRQRVTQNRPTRRDNLRRSERINQEKFVFGGQNYVHLSMLGEGTFAKIHLVERADKKKFALKVIEKATLGGLDMERTRLECTILSISNHNFIVNFFNFYESPKKLFLLLSYYNGGDLYERVTNAVPLYEEDARFYLAELALAIEYIHNKNIIHRDIKMENILIHADGHIALTDFGLAKIELEDPTAGDNGYCGTVEFMAPEMVMMFPYSYAIDVWAFGVIMYEMLTGRLPFEGSSKAETKQDIVFYSLERPMGIGDEAWHFIQKLLCKEPSRRPTTRSESDEETNIKNDKFFTSVNWTRAMNRELSPPLIPTSLQSPN